MTLLRAAGLAKSYPGVRAVDGIDFDVRPGEIHALLGENGAGKSTLIKILAGAVRPDAGTVHVDDAPLHAGDPLEARRRGIRIVYQELMLVPELTAAQNIFLGRELGRPFLCRREMARQAQTALDDLGARVAADDVVGGLSVAQQQLVEIARALLGGSRVLILDEPTAALSGAESARLFGVVRRLRERGLGVVYISHRLEEVFAIADRVTVLRDGRVVATAAAAGLERATVIRWMVGRELAEEFPARTSTPGDVVLEVKNLVCPPRVSDVSLTVRRGEIVGLAGLAGCGRTTVGLALFGVKPAHGEIRLDGRPIAIADPAQALAAGIGYVTEDRKARGLFPALGAGANMTMASLRTVSRLGFLSLAREHAAAAVAATAFNVRAAGLDQPAGTLSGGNQQKLLLARYLMEPRRLLILDEPTRGIDVGARFEIYALMNRLTESGLGILMISSDLPEVLGVSDRVVVLHEGRTAGALARGAATPEAVMHLATGGRA
jgi:ABC-type sugar transport system ATPase subunit